MFTQKQLPQETTVPLSEAVRFDAETQQRIIALAAKLQNQHQQTVTAAELEATAAEVGLEPTFVRQAVEHVYATPGPRAFSGTRSPRHARWLRLLSPGRGSGGIPVGTFLVALPSSLLFGLGHVDFFHFHPSKVYSYALLGLAAVLGFNSTDPKKAFWLGAALLSANMVLLPVQFLGHTPASFPLLECVWYSLTSGGLAGLCSAVRLAGSDRLEPATSAAEAGC